jgi:deoxyribodipyrimidine photolyase-related protein
MAASQLATLIFPHQLYKQHPAVKKEHTVYLIEESLFFNQYKFHKQKIVLHRATMQYYAACLRQQGITVEYKEAKNKEADVRNLIAILAKEKITSIHFCDVTDYWLNKRIHAAALQHTIELVKYPSPNFLNTPESVATFFKGKKHYFQTAFYIQQRKQRNILLLPGNEPEGGQWTFDSDNRLKYPKNLTPPVVSPVATNKYVQEAITYTEKHFKNNYGQSAPFIYPVTFEDAEKWLQNFLKTRFTDFGKYEDAIVEKEHFLHHAVLTPMLNIGLLQPQQIIKAAMAAAPKYNVPLNSLEGFIRQVMGWREFIQIVYEREGVKQRTTNYWGFTRKIPAAFWTGNTGIEPIDTTIKKILETGYCHHIERLMVLGNFMLLCEFDPDEVYKWFMELFIDAYDWVMVPNVYGMTQFADGGLMTTKPYISGSNYLFKMSDYKKGAWGQTWDGLFWRFMHVHRSFFLKNPRLGMLVKTFDKMPEEKQQLHINNAEKYLKQLDN